MTYESYRYLFLIAAALSGLMFLVTLVLFFSLRIPNVIGDLTGRNAKRAIEQIRSQNSSSGVKTYKSSAVNRQRGRLTDKILESGEIYEREEPVGGAMYTAKIGESTAYSQETSLLENPGGEETSVLASEPVGETTAIEYRAETPVYGETVILDQPVQSEFEIEFDITYVHTEEQIW